MADASPESRRQIRREYAALEAQLQTRIRNLLTRIQFTSNHKTSNQWSENNHRIDENFSAVKRNGRFLKDLEIRKAKLRSLYCYQPAASHFCYLLKEYKTKNINNEKKPCEGNRHEPRT